jgi:hypothetical protein
MAGNPWSRPTLSDLKRILETIAISDETHGRKEERIVLSVPAEIITSRGNLVSAMTREISRSGIGFIHKGPISPGDVRVKLTSDTQVIEYRVRLKWCQPCPEGMFLSGGFFLRKIS